jgi:uncharacterized membrane protein
MQPTTTERQPSTTGTLDKSKSRHAITILRPREQVFAFWRNFENLATFMKDIRRIQTVSPEKSHWEIELKSGQTAEWDADIMEEAYGELIAWESVKGSSVTTSGRVMFEDAPDGRSTVVRLSMDYSIPGGKLTEWATFFRGEDPDSLTITNLKRLKALMETGEIPTTEGQPSGRDEDATPVLRH